MSEVLAKDVQQWTSKYPILFAWPSLWATEVHQCQRPHKLCWKLHSIPFLLPHRAGSASSPWAGILTQELDPSHSPRPTGSSPQLFTKGRRGVLQPGTLWLCHVLLAQGTAHPSTPGPHTAVEGPPHASTGPMARGPSSHTFKKHTTASSSSFHSHSHGHQLGSLSLHPWSGTSHPLSTPLGPPGTCLHAGLLR